MNERRTLIDTKLKEVNRLVNSGSFVNIVEASKILEQVMDPAQKLYYHTGLNSDRETLFLCYSYYAYVNETLYNEKHLDKYVNTSLVYYNNAAGLRGEIKKKTELETREMFELYAKIASLYKVISSNQVNDEVLKQVKPAYKFYKKTKNVEDLIHYLSILKYVALIDIHNNDNKKALKVYLKCIKVAKKIFEISKNKETKELLINSYQDTLKLADDLKINLSKMQLDHELNKLMEDRI